MKVATKTIKTGKFNTTMKTLLTLIFVLVAFIANAQYITFNTDKSELTSEAKQTLNAIVASLKAGSSIEIHAHTDDVGNDAYNQLLSERRAVSAVDFLLANGVNASNVTYFAYGETQPTVPNDSPSNRKLNRRVEIRVIEPVVLPPVSVSSFDTLHSKSLTWADVRRDYKGYSTDWFSYISDSTSAKVDSSVVTDSSVVKLGDSVVVEYVHKDTLVTDSVLKVYVPCVIDSLVLMRKAKGNPIHNGYRVEVEVDTTSEAFVTYDQQLVEQVPVPRGLVRLVTDKKVIHDLSKRGYFELQAKKADEALWEYSWATGSLYDAITPLSLQIGSTCQTKKNVVQKVGTALWHLLNPVSTVVALQHGVVFTGAKLVKGYYKLRKALVPAHRDNYYAQTSTENRAWSAKNPEKVQEAKAQALLKVQNNEYTRIRYQDMVKAKLAPTNPNRKDKAVYASETD